MLAFVRSFGIMTIWRSHKHEQKESYEAAILRMCMVHAESLGMPSLSMNHPKKIL